MKVKNWKVYVHINKINKKRYYGITSMKVDKRWRKGKGYDSQYFHRAIEKYGWDNFEHIVIARGLTEEEAKWLEIELIREFDTTNPSKGYNITLGGEGGSGMVFSEERKQELSKKMSGEGNPFYGRSHTEETKGKISETKKGTTLTEEQRRKIGQSSKIWWETATAEKIEERNKKISESNKGKTHTEESKKKMRENHRDISGENHPLYGKHHSEETKRKISESHKGRKDSEETRRKKSESHKGIFCGKNSTSARAVICLTTKKIFYTATEGAEYYNVDNGSIGKCCKGKVKSAGKYKGQKLVWRYLVWEHSKTYRMVRNKEVV